MKFLQVVGGIFMALGLGLAAFIGLLFISTTLADFSAILMMSLSVLQFLYLVPLANLFRLEQKYALAAGLYIGGGLIFLLQSACYGMFMQ